MLELQNASFNYFKKGPAALRDLSCSIEPGIHLLLGENGAGKTTLLKMMAGLLIPSSGRVLLDGFPTDSRQPSMLRRIFFLPDTLSLPTRSIEDYRRATAPLYPDFSEEAFRSCLAEFSLTGSEPFDSLSLGTRRKALLSYALALNVDLLLLDEPANGLDISSKNKLRAMLAGIAPDKTVIISTHTVHDLVEMFEGLMVLSHGSLDVCDLSWRIAERLACVSGYLIPPKALYYEQRAGRVCAIVPNDGALQTELDYTLLYGALLSPARQQILNILHGNE